VGCMRRQTCNRDVVLAKYSHIPHLAKISKSGDLSYGLGSKVIDLVAKFSQSDG
jgi:hypothetical protein